MKDVIIVGAGHNGLVASNYLIDNGFKVTILESNKSIGGLTSSHSFAGRQNISSAATWSGMFHKQIIDDLNIKLDTKILDPQLVYIGENRDDLCIIGKSDTNDICCGLNLNELEKWEEFNSELHDAATFIEKLSLQTTLESRLNLLDSYSDELNFCLSPADEIDSLNSLPPLAQCMALSAGLAIQNNRLDQIGGGFSMAYMASASTNEGAWSILPGGMGSLANTLADRYKQKGGEIILNTPVDRIIESTKGVSCLLTNGDEINAKYCLISAHLSTVKIPHYTKEPAQKGNSAKMIVALSDLPKTYDSIIESAPELTNPNIPTMFILGPSHPEEYYLNGSLTKGNISNPPLVTGSLLISNGLPYLTLYIQIVPYKINSSELSTSVLNLISERLYNDILDKIEAIEISGPAEIQTEFSLPGGHPEHLQMYFPELIFARPSFTATNYKFPNTNRIFHGSASSFPGGLACGVPGRNSALSIMKEFE